MILLAALLAQAPVPETRSELEFLGQVVEAAVSRVSRTQAAFGLGVAQGFHAFRVPGTGVFLVLSPRALPPPAQFVIRAGSPEELRKAMADAQKKAMEEARKRAHTPNEEAQVRLLERQARDFAEEAERSRQEAEQLFELLRRNVEGRPLPTDASTSSGPASPAATAAAPPEPPRRPMPPWRTWFIDEDPPDPRPEAVVVQDVKGALFAALEFAGPRLRSVGDNEAIVVGVDFLTLGAFGMPLRPARTLVLRAQKKDLDQRGRSEISLEELRKRIDVTEY